MVMKKLVSITAMLLALGCGSATANQVELAWASCYGDGGPRNESFACDTNTGSHTLIASFKPDMTSETVNGNEIVVDVSSAGAGLPAWWQFKNTGTCRASALSVTSIPPTPLVQCIDEFAGQATSGIGAYVIGVNASPNRARLIIAEAVPASALALVDPAGEYFSIAIHITNEKTTGTGACSGCLTPMCIVLESIKLTAGGGENDEFISASPGTNCVAWQGGAFSCGCSAETPTRNTTWGAIKSLYR
jgi:hypothetical protein